MSVRTWKQIKWKSKEIKANVEKDYKLGVYEQWGYYIAKAIIKPYTDIPRNKSMGVAPKPVGDKVKMRIPKNDYVKLAKDLIYFVEKKNRMRNYLDYKGKRIRCRLYVYMFSKILVYYAEHKELPNYVDINYRVFYKPEVKKLYDYLTDEGCSGMGQCTPYYCGPNSLQQCFYRLTGIHVSESTIAEIVGTTSDGSDHDGLNTAVAWFNREYNKNIKINWYNFNDLGSNDNERWSKMSSLIKEGAVFCHLLYRDEWGHYEVPKSIGDDLEILNSLGDYCDYPAYCGYIETRSKSTQKRYIQGISQKSIAVLSI